MLKLIPQKTKYLILLLAIVLFFFGEARGQVRTYLTGQKTGNRVQAGSLIGLGPGSAGLSSPMISYGEGCLLGAVITTPFRFYYGDGDILNGSTSNFTTVTAARTFGLAGLLGSGADSYLQFRNISNATIPAGTPTYFKLKQRPSNTGITVPVGGLLGVVELQSIKGEAYIGATNYKKHTGLWSSGDLFTLPCDLPYNGSENNGSIVGSSTTKLMIDAAGDWFAKVTPNAAYNAVRLNVAFPTDLTLANVAAEINVNVYSAFTQANGDACNTSPQFTSPGEATGINLTPAAITAGLGINLNQLLANPEKAINSDKTDYSSFTTGVASLGVASTISQTFYFDHLAASTDAVTIKLGITQALVDLNLLGNGVFFTFYNGDTQVGSSQNLADNLIGLNLLNLITLDGSYKQADVSVKPTTVAPFDRVVVTYNTGLVNANVLGDALRIYDVNITAAKPTFSAAVSDDITICSGNTVELGAITDSGNQLIWYESLSSTTPIQTLAYNATFTTPVLTADKTYYVSAKKCGEESGRAPVRITVNPIYPAPVITVN